MTNLNLRGLLRDRGGSAAIELALVAPVIAGVTLVSFQIWSSGTARQDARAGLDAGVEYYMGGGVDDEAASTVALDAWRKRPDGGTVTTARNYQCGETAAAENAVCTGGRTPATYVTLTATGSDADGKVISEAKVVRVR